MFKPAIDERVVGDSCAYPGRTQWLPDSDCGDGGRNSLLDIF